MLKPFAMSPEACSIPCCSKIQHSLVCAHACALQMRADELDTIIAEIDTDGSGQVDFNEFLQVRHLNEDHDLHAVVFLHVTVHSITEDHLWRV